jgi:hypothetical protein
VGAAAATLLCAISGVGILAASPSSSAAATARTLYVDNVHGTQTTGCTSSGAGACRTIQEGVAAAEALSGTAVTLDVAGSATRYDETVTIDLGAGPGDSLDIEGTGSPGPTLDDQGTGSNVIISSTSVGAVTIDHMTISGGVAVHFGGGIDDMATAPLSIGYDVFSGNKALGTGHNDGDGGAIDFADGCNGFPSGNLTVTESSFVGNSAPFGGAIDAHDCGGTTGSLTVINSTFQGNTAGQGGAVIENNHGSVTNSTFASNSSTASIGGAVIGRNVALVNDTFTANPDAIWNNSGVSIANSILHDVAAGSVECTEGTNATPIIDGGHNVAADASCNFGPTSIQNSTTIGMLTLAANGSSGPLTAAISASSSAFGIVPLNACTVTTDERGQPRPGAFRSSCDAGAYELQGHPPPPMASTGYDLAGSDGGVFVFPTGQPKGFFGSLPGLGIHVNNVAGMVPTNDFSGYDLAGSDGGVFVFPVGLPSGFFGSLPGLGVSVTNVVGMVPTNNDHGYNLVGSDGGVFVFPVGQSAGFFGSLPGLGVTTNDIIGIVVQPGGGGYLLVGRDGGVFAFGNAPFFGSLPGLGIAVNNIVAIASTQDGKGYYLVGSNGAVFPFGDAVNHGSLPALGVAVSNIVSIVPTATGGGYWLIGRDGGVFAFGDAGFIGSLPGLGVNVSNIVGAVPTLF